MAMQTSLKGRLRNTELPMGHGLLPVFEAVVNSIHAIDACGEPHQGKISVSIVREPQLGLGLSEEPRRGAVPLEPIRAFRVTDNGIGFDDPNFSSFETLDSEYKATLGCRGVGRLLWLKAFERASVDSVYRVESGATKRRRFRFTLSGVEGLEVSDSPGSEIRTFVEIDGFKKLYRDRAPKNATTIASALLEHCLWYFVREGGAPLIEVLDGSERISLNSMYEEYMHTSAEIDTFDLGNLAFEVTHLKLKASSKQHPVVAWCAAGRVVKEEPIAGKVPGLFGRLSDKDGEFVYAGYLTSKYLDERVRPERTEFALSEEDGVHGEPGIGKIRAEVLASAKRFLEPFLEANVAASRERVTRFVRDRAPRYRPIMKHVSADRLSVDPGISDKELDMILHKQLAELESSLIAEGHQIMSLGDTEIGEQYKARLSDYLSKVDDIKKSDLADYVFHRKIVLDVLKRVVQKQSDGKYSREDLIHEFIFPMRKTSDEVHLDQSNLWLIDERLAFHDFLASDKPLSSLPITGSSENKEPDIVALSVFDEPLLMSDKGSLPLASIVVVEIKRPMRNDANGTEDKDPIQQALGYLDRVRKGQVQTSSGRPIPRSDEVPGFCYVVCDITPSVETRCRLANLNITSDKMGYFGYNDSYKAYIEVVSYDRLLNSAEERNRAFFSKLGLPHN